MYNISIMLMSIYLQTISQIYDSPKHIIIEKLSIEFFQMSISHGLVYIVLPRFSQPFSLPLIHGLIHYFLYPFVVNKFPLFSSDVLFHIPSISYLLFGNFLPQYYSAASAAIVYPYRRNILTLFFLFNTLFFGFCAICFMLIIIDLYILCLRAFHNIFVQSARLTVLYVLVCPSLVLLLINFLLLYDPRYLNLSDLLFMYAFCEVFRFVEVYFQSCFSVFFFLL